MRIKADYDVAYYDGKAYPVQGEVVATQYDSDRGEFQFLVLVDGVRRFRTVDARSCSEITVNPS